VAECRPWEGGEREHRRLPPQDLGSRDRCHSHRLNLDVGARLISVHLQEHVADAHGRALAMGDDDLDLLHAGHHCGMTTDVANGLVACDRAQQRDGSAARHAWKGRQRNVEVTHADRVIGHSWLAVAVRPVTGFW